LVFDQAYRVKMTRPSINRGANNSCTPGCTTRAPHDRGTCRPRPIRSFEATRHSLNRRRRPWPNRCCQGVNDDFLLPQLCRQLKRALAPGPRSWRCPCGSRACRAAIDANKPRRVRVQVALFAVLQSLLRQIVRLGAAAAHPRESRQAGEIPSQPERVIGAPPGKQGCSYSTRSVVNWPSPDPSAQNGNRVLFIPRRNAESPAFRIDGYPARGKSSWGAVLAHRRGIWWRFVRAPRC
jgi:hypothetical protein